MLFPCIWSACAAISLGSSISSSWFAVPLTSPWFEPRFLENTWLTWPFVWKHHDCHHVDSVDVAHFAAFFATCRGLWSSTTLTRAMAAFQINDWIRAMGSWLGCLLFGDRHIGPIGIGTIGLSNHSLSHVGGPRRRYCQMTIRPVATSSRLDSGWILGSDRLQKNDGPKHVGLDVSMLNFLRRPSKRPVGKAPSSPQPWTLSLVARTLRSCVFFDFKSLTIIYNSFHIMHFMILRWSFSILWWCEMADIISYHFISSFHEDFWCILGTFQECVTPAKMTWKLPTPLGCPFFVLVAWSRHIWYIDQMQGEMIDLHMWFINRYIYKYINIFRYKYKDMYICLQICKETDNHKEIDVKIDVRYVWYIW